MESFISPQETNPVLSSLFTDRYAITPLETSAECLVGRIEKIKKFRGHYYILSNGQTILHFNEEGRFISSLNKTGQGPEEYHRIEDFDIYEVNGQTEIWVSDNRNLKVYDADNSSYKYKVAYPFVIHKFKRMSNGHILLVTGLSDYSLTLTDREGTIISEYLEKEIPFLMFRPVQFVRYGSDYIYQLGISNAYVSFDPETENFSRGIYSGDRSFISDRQLLDLFERHEMDFIGEANKQTYISNVVSYRNIMWVNTNRNGESYLTKVLPDQTVSTVFSAGSPIKNDLFPLNDTSFISTVITGESDDSLILYIEAHVLSGAKGVINDKFGNAVHCNPEDNPCILEFM